MAKSYLIDMDGVLLRGAQAVPGAAEFIERLKKREAKFLVLTNNSEYFPEEVEARFARAGILVPQTSIYTSAQATALFLKTQKLAASVFVLGERALTTALESAGCRLAEENPDYVVIGKTHHYDYERISWAVRHIRNGARLIATNADPTAPSEKGIVPGNGAMVALVERASGATAYAIGKPNPLMLRTALQRLNDTTGHAVMVGDRMDSDIVMGIEAGMETILVLTGVTQKPDIDRYPYRPTIVLPSVAQIEIH